MGKRKGYSHVVYNGLSYGKKKAHYAGAGGTRHPAPDSGWETGVSYSSCCHGAFCGSTGSFSEGLRLCGAKPASNTKPYSNGYAPSAPHGDSDSSTYAYFHTRTDTYTAADAHSGGYINRNTNTNSNARAPSGAASSARG